MAASACGASARRRPAGALWLLVLWIALAACSRGAESPAATAPVASSTGVQPSPTAQRLPETLAAPPSLLISPVPTTPQQVSPTPATVTPTRTPDSPPAPILTPLSPENAAGLVQLHQVRFSPWELVMALAWAPDGEMLAVSAGENIHLYRASDWSRLATMSTGAFTHSLAFSPDGAWLAAGSRDGFLRAWWIAGVQTAEAAQPDLSLLAHKKGVNSVAFSPDGRLLASGGNDAVARFWALPGGEMLGQVIGGTFAVPSIAFDPTGEVLAMVNGNMIRLREVESGRITGTFMIEAASFFSLVVSPDGELLAAGDSDNLVRLWNIKDAFRTGQERYPQPLELAGHDGDPGTYRALVWRLAFSPDGRLLASAGGDWSLRLWDVAQGQLIATLAGHTSGVTCLAFRPDGRGLASGGLDGALLIWGIER